METLFVTKTTVQQHTKEEKKRSVTNITASTLCHAYGYRQLYDAIKSKLIQIELKQINEMSPHTICKG